VPWHDSGWEGTVCADPLNNGSCLRLGRIAAERKDAVEVQIAGKKWSELEPADVPPCASERAGFMADHRRQVVKHHPYASWNETYRKFLPTTFEIPAYTADCVPFRWMLRDNAEEIIDRYRLNYSADVEAEVDSEADLKNPSWVQHADNQTALLDTFFSAAQPEKSLCFIYAKESPLADDNRRILIGVGRVKHVGSVIPYKQDGGGFGSVLWERVVQHSIRPTMEDGFLLPYHQLLELGAEGTIDPAEFAVFVPEEFTTQFSYATEHVSHDAALALLLSLSTTVKKLAGLTPGNWTNVSQWLSDRISEIWQARGVCPGLGSALRAFGVSEGVLVAHTIQSRLTKPDDDPWPLVDQLLSAPAGDPDNADRISLTLSKMWTKLPDERRDLLKLLSRFDLSIDQATRFFQPTERQKASIDTTDSEIVANPYRIYELDRPSLEPVSVTTIDRGVFPPDQIRLNHPLPQPTAIDDQFDPRRVRALLVEQLERAAMAGDTLRSQDRLIQAVRDEPLDPECPLSIDMMAVVADDLSPEIETVAMADGSPAFQLRRFASAKTAIVREIRRRRKAARLDVAADWRGMIDALLGDAAADDEDEPIARSEKAAALEVLATSRVSVLIGAAGTGKTTLLKALCALPGVEEQGFLLLAPTGKARVRMQTAIGRSAETVAQLLVKSGRYNPETGRYQRSEHNRRSGFGTVIIDECSMLTEDQLDAVLDGIEGYSRLILVGDPRQLPPIGAGRPFIDITNFLRSEAGINGANRVGDSYAELMVRRRQVAEGSKNTERPDLVLAEWFSGEDPSPGADAVWDALGRDEDLGTIRIREWTTPSDLHALMQAELADELDEMSDVDDAVGFQQSYGGNLHEGHVYFRRGAAKSAERWQILSPIRGEGGGVNELNRMLHRKYRASHLELAAEPTPWKRRIPAAAGPQEVIYGDKVINVRNKTRRHYFPKNDDVIEYVANGEIGVVVGPFRGQNKKVPLSKLNVEFSTQPDVAYDFWMNELGSDDGSPYLELAYAITIHKSQGSEFGTTFVVIPNPCRLLSRELLYTALTRQQHRVVVLHQGQLSDLRQYSDAAHSEAAARTTNLFVDPAPVEVNGKFLERGLIHQTRKGILVRSKSEVIVADLLYSKNIEFQYEQGLTVSDGTSRFPDFTIVDDMTGTTYYWEHLGMLSRPSYRTKWEAKREWYRSHGILHHDEGGGPNGTLLTTEDGDDGSISSAAIEALIDEVLG
jgi:ATP-dependent exoDNAse (exonuclease V) alpha subunit